jgi:TetR/AcrR family transcriptional regulator, copper-responsive repressor
MRTDTKQPSRRGRPRAYDPDVALENALSVFWENGYSATSLDMLSEATEMNRPSLYAAFGDKQSIYLKSFARIAERMGMEFSKRLNEENDIATALARFFAHAIDVYLSGESGRRGCFVMSTATAEAINDTHIQKSLAVVTNQIDSILEKRLACAKAEGQLPAKADTTELALLAGATLHSLSIRARAGQRRPTLEALAKTAVATIVGKQKKRR